jgi:hypothetical protein
VAELNEQLYVNNNFISSIKLLEIEAQIEQDKLNND